MRIIVGIGVVLAVVLATGCGQPTIEERYADLTAVAEGTKVAKLEAEVAATATAVVAHLTATPVPPTPTPTPTPETTAICIVYDAGAGVVLDRVVLEHPLPIRVNSLGEIENVEDIPEAPAILRNIDVFAGGPWEEYDGEGKTIIAMKDCTISLPPSGLRYQP